MEQNRVYWSIFDFDNRAALYLYFQQTSTELLFYYQLTSLWSTQQFSFWAIGVQIGKIPVLY